MYSISHFSFSGIIPKSFLLIVDSGAAMFRLDPDVFSYTRLPIQNLQSPVAIDYDPEEDRVYWTDIRAKEIRSAFLNGTNNQLIFSLHPGMFYFLSNDLFNSFLEDDVWLFLPLYSFLTTDSRFFFIMLYYPCLYVVLFWVFFSFVF